MELAACKPLLLLTVFITFLNIIAFCDGRPTNFVKNNPKKVEKDEGQSQTRIPVVDYTSPVEPVEYDPYGSLVGDQDGLKGGLLFNRPYPQGNYGGPSYGYGYGYGAPYQGGIFGLLPRGGLFGFPRGLFGLPQGILGLPRIFFGYPGGGYGGNPGAYGGNPGGYGGGLPGPGNRPGGGGYPGYGGRAEVKSKEVNPHD